MYDLYKGKFLYDLETTYYWEEEHDFDYQSKFEKSMISNIGKIL